MKQLLFILFSFAVVSHGWAYQTKHKPDPKAKALNDSAAKKYQQAMGDRTKLQPILKLLDAAIKTDSGYYEAWNNKLSLLGQLDQFENEYKSLKTMTRLFPGTEDVQFNLGILEYKTNRSKDAIATFTGLLNHYNMLLEKNKNNGNTRGLLYYKGIVLILLNRESEGKAILTNLFTSENNQYTKSQIGFYVNSSRQEIIEDRVPGK